MRDIPLSVFLAWPTANYEDPPTRGNALLIINIIFLSLVTLSIGIRLWSRFKVKYQSGMDDVMIVLAYVFTIGMTAVVLLANRNYGWNRHLWDVPVHMIEQANRIAFVAKIMFTLASSFTRLSLIFLYYRLIRDTSLRWYSWVLHFSLAFNIIIIISFVLLVVFTCIPVQAYWQFPNVIDGKCLDEGIMTLSCGIVSCIADLQCTLLPIPAIMRLSMPLRQRIGVCVLLSAGIIVTIAGVIRTYFIWKSLIDTYDETWYTYPLWICAALELDIAVICACIPAMKNVLWAPLRRWTSSVYSHWHTASNRGSKTDPSGICSQDPIVDGSAQDEYQLNQMAFEKNGHYKRNQDPSVLEKAIAQIPLHHHPHSRNILANDSFNNSSKLERQASPEPLLHSGINKETSFEVSSTTVSPSYNKGFRDLPIVPPPGQRSHRPRHQPLVPMQRLDNAMPRALEGVSTRHNASPGMAPSALPQYSAVQHANSARSPLPTPWSLLSDETSPRVTSPQKKREGRTFYLD